MFAELLNSYGQIGVEVLRNSIAGLEATGRTAASIRYESSEDRLTIYGRAYFELIEKGIRPSGKSPSRQMIEFLTDYARARGMDNPESAAWAIAKTILKKGDRTYRSGGRIVYSPELDKFVEELKSAIGKEFSVMYITHIKKAFNGGSS